MRIEMVVVGLPVLAGAAFVGTVIFVIPAWVPADASPLFAVLFVSGFLLLFGLLYMGVIHALIRRYPEQFLPEEALRHDDLLIRQEQAKSMEYGFPEDDVEMIPSNCDI